MVIWLIGLSGAGKTTLATCLHEALKPKRENLVLLDGDILREVWGDSLGHNIEARQRNAHRISHLCRMLDAQNIHVIAAVLSLFPDWQAWNRKNFSSYYEVFLDVPMEILRQRDTKGLYAKAFGGEIDNVVGVDIPFPPPPAPDLVLADADTSPEEATARLLAALPPLA